MYIICKQCDAKYKIKKNAIDARGRMVHCNHCDYEWIAHPDDNNVINNRQFFVWHTKVYLAIFIIAILYSVLYLQGDKIFAFATKDKSLISQKVSVAKPQSTTEENISILKVQVHNASDAISYLDDLLIILYDDKMHPIFTKINNIGIHISPQKTIIIPIEVPINAQIIHSSRIFIGGKGYLLLKSIAH